jgi:prepilin-type N-terminal cleavage/methylation domain-containing protein
MREHALTFGRRGMTLMELMMVLVVLGIGALVVASSGLSMRAPGTPPGLRDSTAIMLRRARAEAIMSGRRVSFVVFANSQRIPASAFPDGRIVTLVGSQVVLPVER